jgi:hypothetical protein
MISSSVKVFLSDKTLGAEIQSVNLREIGDNDFAAIYLIAPGSIAW